MLSTPAAAGQRNLREKLRLGDSDLGIRGDQVLFGCTNIGTALQKRRGKPRRD